MAETTNPSDARLTHVWRQTMVVFIAVLAIPLGLLSFSDRPYLLEPPGGTIVKLCLAYALLALAFNRTTFSKTSRGLEVRHGPVPVPGLRRSFIPWSSIADIQAEPHPRSPFTRFHSLVIAQHAGPPRVVLDYVPERQAVRLASVLREWMDAEKE